MGGCWAHPGEEFVRTWACGLERAVNDVYLFDRAGVVVSTLSGALPLGEGIK